MLLLLLGQTDRSGSKGPCAGKERDRLWHSQTREPEGSGCEVAGSAAVTGRKEWGRAAAKV